MTGHSPIAERSLEQARLSFAVIRINAHEEFSSPKLGLITKNNTKLLT